MPQPLPKSQPLNVPQTLAQALALHQQGKLAEAGQLYAAILAVRPDHIDALQMMGLVRLAAGQPAEALRLIGAAMASRKTPQILLNHGLALNALKRHAEALDSFDQAIKLKSKYAEAHNNRAAALAALGRDEAALDSYRKAIAIKPDYAEAQYNLGNSLRALGRHDEALACFDRALKLRPKYLRAHNNRGAVLEALGRETDALVCYEQALAIDPSYSEARDNRSRVLGLLHRFDEALDSFDRALAQNPSSAEVYYNRGCMQIDLNRNEEARADFARALAIRPGYAEARFAACFAELPILYADEAEIARCRAAYETSLRHLRDDVAAGRLTGDLIKAGVARQPFFLAYQGQVDRDLQAIYGDMIGRAVAQRFPEAAPLAPPPMPGEPIRVGIVSAHFYLHSNWKIPIKGWVEQLDRSRFKVFGYHLGTRRDAETAIAESLCDRFVHRTLDVDGWRREILADAPHVLIYPGLLMDTLSLPLAAQRLAPVQCTSWGHPETSGLATLDHYLSSDLMEPPDAAAHYTENLVRLPNLSIYYEPVATALVPVTRAELGLRDDAAAFWCGQSLFKYLPQHDSVFARIARVAGNCQFVFVRHSGGPGINTLFEARLAKAFAAEGLNAADHCVFLPRMSQSKFGAAIGQCDVFLDSIDWSGCNSALESLPHNLPIVTLPGATMRGRHSAAILQMMGVTDTIAADVDGFIAIAARLANDADARRVLSERIAAAKPKLYRDRACIIALEDFLARAVRRQDR
ncbi:MAG: tetratricopeptide repeat protein [Bradyrhizobium sp.]|nr:tetratricopeptide repeat protein [Bradyrhizobium sp.]